MAIKDGNKTITPIGRFLRRWSLDEIPQLINVLKGDMSLVGPRPDLPFQVAEYDGKAKRRLAVRPGITGLAQIAGRNELSFAERRELDLEYIKNYSLWLDLKILLATPIVVLSGRGLYPERRRDEAS
jgi:lipopolysaccharide/colanic/teichoic acid biosynthesis glycosyltransferase